MVLRKKLKVNPKWENPETIDRLSNLPEDILVQMLSFLPTKYAVATGVLSSRWKNLYKLTNTLDFDDSATIKPSNGLTSMRRNARFRQFVESHLSRIDDSKVTKFRLKCGKDNFENSLIKDWIEVACSHNISELELSVHNRAPCELPLQKYSSTCQNLVVLKLDNNIEVEVPDSVAFPRLKVLVLRNVTFSVDTPLNGMLPKCPSLEDLVIEGCDIDMDDLYITNPFLRRLTLGDGLAGPFDQLSNRVTYLDAPNLIYLNYCKCLADQYIIRNLNALVEAHIKISFNDDDFDDPESLCECLLDLINGVSKCRLLYLSGQCLEALACDIFQLPRFQNLIRLELGVGCDVSWNDVLLDFLNSSPLLESLVFEEGLINFNAMVGEPENQFLLDEKAVPPCVVSRLKVVKIKRFWGLAEELDVAKYFLQNANVLEKLEIYWCLKKSLMDKISKEKEILKMHKASDACCIAFM